MIVINRETTLSFDMSVRPLFDHTITTTKHLLSNKKFPSLTLCFKKRSFSIIMIGPSVRTTQLGLFVNLGILELTYRVQTLRDYSFSSMI